MISCKDVAKALASDQVRLLPWRRRLELRLHLMLCKLCSQLARDFRQMRASVRQAAREHEPEGGFEVRILRSLAGGDRGQSDSR